MSTPCAACKCLRRKCTQDCVFAPYFPANKQENYTAVHKIFGTSHVAKILNDVHPSQREDAMNSLVFEAQARLLDPVYGCTPIIYNLQRQLKDLEDQLQFARNELASYTIVSTLESPPMITFQQYHESFSNMELCTTCKEARQECTQECMLVPYLPANKPEKYACLSKVFSVRKVVKLLEDLDPSQRQACVDSLCFEAEARIRDPLFGCVGIILLLQRRLQNLNLMLEISERELIEIGVIGHGQNHQDPIKRSRL